MKTFKTFPETDCPRANALVVEPFCLGDFFIMGNEMWEPVRGFYGIYEISTFGNVKSHSRKGGLLKNVLDSHGYYQVSLSFNGFVTKHKVHRLVAQAFLGLKKDEHVDHIDGVRTNNRLDNLRKCSLVENLRFDNVKKNKTSKYVGVSKFGNKWRAQIQVNKIKISLGLFDTEEKAYIAYQSYLLTLK